MNSLATLTESTCQSTVVHQFDVEGRDSNEAEKVDGDNEVFTTPEEDGKQSGKGGA